MSLSVELVGFSALKVGIADLPRAFQVAVTKAMTVVAAELERTVDQEKLSGQLLDTRTGNLKRATFHRVGSLPDGSVTAMVGVDIKKAIYGRIQEVGGIITPKSSRYLTIPLDAVKTANGVARFRARDVIASPGSFGYVGTFFRNQVLFGKTRDKDIVPLFALKESVTLKGVGYLTSTVEEKRAWSEEMVQEAVTNEFKRILEHASSGE